MTGIKTKTQPSGKATRLVIVAAVAMMLLPLAAVDGAWAQDEEEPASTYTRVEMWEVGRDDWGDFVASFEKHDQPIMEKLFADGVITEWGIDSAMLHRPDDYTHSTWYSASSMSALVKAGAAYEEAWKAYGDDADKAFNAMVGRHRDYVLETEGMRSVAATLDDGYFQGHSVKLLAEKHRDFMSYWKNRMAPIYEQLLDDGAIVAFGVSSEGVVTESPSMLSWWCVMADADGFDKVEAAFDASWGGMDSEGRRARWLSIMDTVEADSYRSWVTTIDHMQVAAH